MTRLEKLIETLSERATDSDLLALLGTSREVRLYNGALARELREIVETLKHETDQRVCEGRQILPGASFGTLRRRPPGRFAGA